VDAFGNPSEPGGAALLLNRAHDPRVVPLRASMLPEGPDTIPALEGDWLDVLSGRTVRALEGGLSVALPPLSAMLLLRI